MSFLDPIVADELRKKVTKDLSKLGKLYKSKKNAYYVKSVDHNEVEDYIKDGWEENGKPLKTRSRVRNEKSHSSKFEDDIWCQLYELGFRHLNYTNDFILPFGKGPLDKKQIDVIAISDDCIILVECKSSLKRTKSPSLKTEFEGLPIRLDGYKKSLEEIFGKGKRIKYIFATRNIKLDRDSADIERLLSTKSFFYNDNTYDYVNSLLKTYKDASHYQFLAMLFKGEEINKERIEVPAVEGRMGGKTYYMFSIEPSHLLKIGFVLHRTRANAHEMPTYQRLLVPSRLKGIAKFIDNGGYFPNSVILNFSEKKNKLQFEGAARGNDTSSRYGTLKIPNAYAIAYIIDGQHRVYGYAKSAYKKTNTIPVVAFLGLDSSEQLSIFMDINQNQKAVSPTLRITLEEDLFWASDRIDTRMKALKSSVIQELGCSLSSPLYNKISIGEDRADLSANPFSTVLSRCGLLPIAQGNKYDEETSFSSLYDINNHDHALEMDRAKDRIYTFIRNCYQYVEDNYPEIFNSEKSLIISNRGTFAFISLIGSLNKFETSCKNVNCKTNSDKRFEAVEKYLSALLRGLQDLSIDEENQLLDKLGSGAENLWFRRFQSIVNKKFPEYKPPDFLDWLERQNDDLQNEGRRYGIATEKFLKRTVIGTLKSLFGDNWDIEIGAIQRDCEKRAKEEVEKRYKEGLGRQDIPWTDQFYIADYKKIIEAYWTKKPNQVPANFKNFEETFSIDVGHGFNSKAEKLKWLSIFNSYRNCWAHEGTKEKKLNREEVDFLKKVHDHLLADAC